MTYTYFCNNCEKTTEVKKPLKEIDKVELCEVCSTEMQRVIRHTNLVQYRTGGFYNTGDL